MRKSHRDFSSLFSSVEFWVNKLVGPVLIKIKVNFLGSFVFMDLQKLLIRREVHRLALVEGMALNPKNTRTIEEINAKIRKGDAQVLTAEEMKRLVESSSVEVAFKEVDVVTTGTFGAMCSSGAIINMGHSDPPMKIDNAFINDVPICHPGAAVDLYIGATAMSTSQPFEYGGGHLIEDLVSGKEVELKATAYGTDCYPRTQLKTNFTSDDLNQFYLLNFRNCYQRYNCAVNSRDEIIYTYMGKLLPHMRNATYSGAGELNPLMNDPDYETIGIGTRIFLGGGQGYVIGEGTQHEAQKPKRYSNGSRKRQENER